MKSGKYVKTNVNIKVQEQWPHMNVMRKYSRRVVFDALEFDAFVAGEMKTILQMGDRQAAQRRLEFLCKIAHWQCRAKDWTLIRGLYEAVIESIELREETWRKDFSHYETMVPCAQRVETREKERVDSKRKDKSEVYWCKNFQKGTCQEKSPHMVLMKPDKPPVPVIHCCAFCLQKENKRSDHAEVDCPAKKGGS